MPPSRSRCVVGPMNKFGDLNLRRPKESPDLIALRAREDIPALHHDHLTRADVFPGKEAAAIDRAFALFHLGRKIGQVVFPAHRLLLDGQRVAGLRAGHRVAGRVKVKATPPLGEEMLLPHDRRSGAECSAKQLQL